MEHYGRRTVRMKFEGARGYGGATFEVTDVRQPIFSVSALVKSGHTVLLSPMNAHLLRPTGETIALEMRNGLPYVRVTVEEKKQQSPRFPLRKVIDEVNADPPTVGTSAARAPSSHAVAPERQTIGRSAASGPIPLGEEKRPAARDAGPLSRRTAELLIQEINEGYERELKGNAEA